MLAADWPATSKEIAIHGRTGKSKPDPSRLKAGKLKPVPSRSSFFRKKFILAGGHVRASAGALAVHTALILAGGHVRASAGALAVHTALIPCVWVCVRVCPVSNSFFITPRIGTKFVSVDREAPGRWPTATGFFLCSALAEQRPSKPTTPQKTFDFSVSFRQYSESNLRSMQWTREAKNRSFNVQTVK